MPNPTHQLYALDQSLWYDNIQRRLLQDGTLEAMIAAEEIRGVTSNPSIFRAAIAESDDYDEALKTLSRQGLSPEAIFERLSIEDIRAAADLFRPLYDQTDGGDGYVSLEVNPHLAYDAARTTSEALRLWKEVDRPNLMVKIPATQPGLEAITHCIAAGANINVTLIFALDRYQEVIDAYLHGLALRKQENQPIDRVASVASFFVSRVDTKVDQHLQAIIRAEGPGAQQAYGLLGKAAVANARLAYQLFKGVFFSSQFAAFKGEGARVQRPLWASTSTKNPDYSDVKYVEELIGPQTVNTVPQVTLDAFRDHGTAELTIERDLDEVRRALEALEALGVSMQRVTEELEQEGVQAFADAYDALLDAIRQRM